MPWPGWGDPADATRPARAGRPRRHRPRRSAWADDADRQTPRLRTHRPTGERADEVEYHPAYHPLMRAAPSSTGSPPSRGRGPPTRRARRRRAAGFMVWSQVEAGHGCPVSMTYAVVAGARGRARPRRDVGAPARLAAPTTRARPVGDKAGALVGMGMTEKQGGSDVRANTTRAVRRRTAGGRSRLPAHRAQVVLLGTDERRVPRAGPGAGRPACFVVPRVLDDGARNAFAIQRLKDKLGNRSNASSEIELDGAVGLRRRRRGPRRPDDHRDGRRDPARLRARLGRHDARGAARAVHHARHRSAFGAAAGRPAADAQRARRPGGRERGGDPARVCGCAHAVDDRRVRVRAGSRSRRPSSGSASAPRRWSPRRWSAWAATGTSRRTGWPGSTARRRSTRSGRARATSTPRRPARARPRARSLSRRSTRSSPRRAVWTGGWTRP